MSCFRVATDRLAVCAAHEAPVPVREVFEPTGTGCRVRGGPPHRADRSPDRQACWVRSERTGRDRLGRVSVVDFAYLPQIPVKPESNDVNRRRHPHPGEAILKAGPTVAACSVGSKAKAPN